MAAISHSESKAWWGNKFSPKNSKWLQSNISETEKKVGAMVKILEEDFDSFARRADMYYKRRPELMLLAKEFYGAYRALAERYDVAAGALRVATRSLADAFPNQTPPSLSLPDEPPSTHLSEPQTPDMPPPARSLIDTDELNKDKIGNSPNAHENNSEGLKQVSDLFQGEPKARKGLSFQADKAQKTKHEDGVGLQMASLQRDLALQIQDTCDLSNKLQILTAQTEAAIKINKLLKEAFTKYEVERGILSEKYAVLEKELSDTTVELKVLRERVSELEISEESLSNQISVHVSEKADLASYFSEIYEKNSALESSLFDVSEKLKASEASCQSLISQKSGLVAERDDLFCQIESMTAVIKSLEDKHRESKENHSALLKEIDIKQNHLNKLQELLGSKVVEHELHVVLFQDQMEYLFEKNSGQLSEIKHLSQKLEDTEAAHQLLIDQNQDLLTVDNITVAMKNLEEKHQALSDERDLLQNNLKELELLFSAKTKECEDAVRSHEINVTTLRDQISEHIYEKTTLVSEIKELYHIIEAILTKNGELESSLSNINAEMEDMKRN